MFYGFHLRLNGAQILTSMVSGRICPAPLNHDPALFLLKTYNDLQLVFTKSTDYITNVIYHMYNRGLVET